MIHTSAHLVMSNGTAQRARGDSFSLTYDAVDQARPNTIEANDLTGKAGETIGAKMPRQEILPDTIGSSAAISACDKDEEVDFIERPLS